MSSAILLQDPYKALEVVIPEKQLLRGSIAITSKKELPDWTEYAHGCSFDSFKKIIEAWKNSNGTTSYAIYGKWSPGSLFAWEILPYQKCRTILGRMIQQIQVLWRIVFGGLPVTEKTRLEQAEKLQSAFTSPAVPQEARPIKRDDAFCKSETIQRQVILSGKKVNVLFSQAPIGFGGEKLHFLAVPKEHRESFADLTKEEYVESLQLTQKLVAHLRKKREIRDVHLLSKSGVDAGQVQDHWLLHVICTTTAAQDFWGKLAVFKNILFGASPMKENALASRITELRDEFAEVG